MITTSPPYSPSLTLTEKSHSETVERRLLDDLLAHQSIQPQPETTTSVASKLTSPQI